MGYLWHDSIQGHLGSFGLHLSANGLLNRKRLTVERNGLKFETRGMLVEHIWATFDFVVVKLILESISALV